MLIDGGWGDLVNVVAEFLEARPCWVVVQVIAVLLVAFVSWVRVEQYQEWRDRRQ